MPVVGVAQLPSVWFRLLLPLFDFFPSALPPGWVCRLN